MLDTFPCIIMTTEHLSSLLSIPNELYTLKKLNGKDEKTTLDKRWIQRCSSMSRLVCSDLVSRGALMKLKTDMLSPCVLAG